MPTSSVINQKPCCSTYYNEHATKCAVVSAILAVAAAAFVAIAAMGICPPIGNLPAMIGGAIGFVICTITTIVLCAKKNVKTSNPPVNPQPIPRPTTHSLPIQPPLDVRTATLEQLKDKYLPSAIIFKEMDDFKIGVDRLALANQLDFKSVRQNGQILNIYHLIASHGNAEMLAYVQTKTPFEDLTDPKCQDTTIHFAVIGDNPSMIAPLKALGADLDKKNKTGSTPLHIAVILERLECVKALVEAGANLSPLNHEEKTPYTLLINQPLSDQNTYNDIKNYLESIPKQNYEILYRAAIDKDLDTFLGALNRLKNTGELNIQYTDEFGRNCFHQIALYGTAEMLEHLNAQLQFEDVCATLGYEGKNYTVMHFAVFGNNASVISTLKKMGANLNAQNTFGNTPLHHSVESADGLDCLKALVAAGADLKIKNQIEKTPYEFLVAQAPHDNTKAMKKILEEKLTISRLATKKRLVVNV